ncbi:MAG: 5-oxoprolinase subunit PxpA [Proteobacteria bacterium]|nr:5-oxoprolinase subunit PxpA [Pseudomonadota bacterium]
MDINCDLGEYEDAADGYKDAQIMPFISACNIACGGHAGSKVSMRHSVLLALENDVAIGAHPSYPDVANFGRLSMQVPHDQLFDLLTEQVDALKDIAEQQQVKLHHIKPHGALYNDAAVDLAVAQVIAEALKAIDPNLKLYGQAHSALAEAAQANNLHFVAEGFIDRRYLSRYQLLPRNHPDALIQSLQDQLRQAEYLISRKGLYGHDGEWLSVDCQSLCLHGDQPDAIATAQAMKDLLYKLGVTLSRPL